MPFAEKRGRWRDPEVAATYDQRRFHGRRGRIKHARDARLILGLLGELEGVRSVLDLPAGTGRLWPDLAAGGYGPIGADLSREMLRAAGERQEHAVGMLVAEGERLPFADDSVDAVVSLRFLFHVDDPVVRTRILGEMSRVARLGVIGEVRWGATAKHLGRRARRASKLRPALGNEALDRELGAAGLEPMRVRPVSRLFSDKALFLARPIA